MWHISILLLVAFYYCFLGLSHGEVLSERWNMLDFHWFWTRVRALRAWENIRQCSKNDKDRCCSHQLFVLILSIRQNATTKDLWSGLRLFYWSIIWSVALVLCLNIGIDPPDVTKTVPCSKLEAWIDPLSLPPQKALEAIGRNLQSQYEVIIVTS